MNAHDVRHRRPVTQNIYMRPPWTGYILLKFLYDKNFLENLVKSVFLTEIYMKFAYFSCCLWLNSYKIVIFKITCNRQDPGFATSF